MFTGIIEDLGIVKALEKKQNYKLSVESLIFKDQKIGESIAVNGVCLTISDLKNTMASFDIMSETIKITDLANLRVGDRVNLERALKIGDRLSGHFVAGHIDYVGKIIEKGKRPENYYVKVKISEEDVGFIAPKGSIALDGISLTIAERGRGSFTVYLIPHTIEKTNLKFKDAGDNLNIEFDLLGKYALKSRSTPIITEDFLREHGY